jgi:hypothetical protein
VRHRSRGGLRSLASLTEEEIGPTTAFEVPQPLRQLVEKNVEQAGELYAQFMDAAAQGPCV